MKITWLRKRTEILLVTLSLTAFTPLVPTSPKAEVPPCSPRTEPKPIQGDDPSGLYRYFSDGDHLNSTQGYYCYERALRLLSDQPSPVEFQWWLRQNKKNTRLILSGILKQKKDTLRRTRKIQRPPIQSESAIWSGAINPYELSAWAAKGEEVPTESSLPIVEAAQLTFYKDGQRVVVNVWLGSSTARLTFEKFRYEYTLTVSQTKDIFVEWSPLNVNSDFISALQKETGYNPILKFQNVSVFRFKEPPSLSVGFEKSFPPVLTSSRFAIRDSKGKMLAGFDTSVYIPERR